MAGMISRFAGITSTLLPSEYALTMRSLAAFLRLERSDLLRFLLIFFRLFSLSISITPFAELNTLLNIDSNAIENADIAAERKNNTADIVEDKPKAHEPPKMDKKPSILEQIKALKSVGKAQAEPKPPVKGKENEI